MADYTEEEVETAAQVLYKRDNDTPIPWERLTERHESTKDIFRMDARAVLDAVVPSIAARAINEWLDTAGLEETFNAVMSRVIVNVDPDFVMPGNEDDEPLSGLQPGGSCRGRMEDE